MVLLTSETFVEHERCRCGSMANCKHAADVHCCALQCLSNSVLVRSEANTAKMQSPPHHAAASGAPRPSSYFDDALNEAISVALVHQHGLARNGPLATSGQPPVAQLALRGDRSDRAFRGSVDGAAGLPPLPTSASVPSTTTGHAAFLQRAATLLLHSPVLDAMRPTPSSMSAPQSHRSAANSDAVERGNLLFAERRRPALLPGRLFGSKAKRLTSLEHPLAEQRPSLDVWPADSASRPTPGVASNDGRPDGGASRTLAKTAFLFALETTIDEELGRLNREHPGITPPVVMVSPSDDDGGGGDGRSSVASPKGSRGKKPHTAIPAKNGSAMKACDAVDAYRLGRVGVFRDAALAFAWQFRIYGDVLKRIVAEFESFIAFCHENVWSPQSREEFRAQARAAAVALVASEMSSLRAQLEAAQSELKRLRDIAASAEGIRTTLTEQIISRDAVISQHQKEAAEFQSARTLLLGRLEAQDMEIWRMTKEQEEPMAVISRLTAENKVLEEKLGRAAAAIESLNQDRMRMSDKMHELDVQLRERKKLATQQTVPTAVKSELASMKRREADLAALNSNLQQRLLRSEQRLADMSDTLAMVRKEREAALEGTSMSAASTPRPVWHDLVNEFSLPLHLTTTSRRVAAFAQVARQAVKERDAAQKTVTALRDMLGQGFRENKWLRRHDVSGAMLAPWVGVPLAVAVEEDASSSVATSSIPSVALPADAAGAVAGGEGPPTVRIASTIFVTKQRIPNAHFTLDLTARLCRVWWAERQESAPGTEMATFMEHFSVAHAPADFIPSAHATMPPGGSSSSERAAPPPPRAGSSASAPEDPWWQAQTFRSNFEAALSWYAFDPFIGLTRALVSGDVEERVLQDIQNYVARLRLGMLTAPASVAPGSPPPPALPAAAIAVQVAERSKTDAVALLVELLADREDDEIRRLVVAISKDCPGRDVRIDALFAFDPTECQFSAFLEELFRQLIDDRRVGQQWLLDTFAACDLDVHPVVQRATEDASDPVARGTTGESNSNGGGSSASGGLRSRRSSAALPSTVSGLPPGDQSILSTTEHMITVPVVAQVLFTLDPLMPAVYADSLVAKLFAVPSSDLYPTVDKHDGSIKRVGIDGERRYGCADTVAAPFHTFMDRLQRTSVLRFSKKSHIVDLARQRMAAGNRVASAATYVSLASDDVGASGAESSSRRGHQRPAKAYTFRQYLLAKGVATGDGNEVGASVDSPSGSPSSVNLPGGRSDDSDFMGSSILRRGPSSSFM